MHRPPLARCLLHGLALSLAAVAGVARAAPPPPTLTMPDMPLHDPWIVADRATRTYWLFTRNEAAMTGDRRLGIMAYSSRDLKRWSRPRVVFAAPAAMWANDGAWAPEVHRWNGRWYLMATFHNDALALPAPAAGRKAVRRGTVLAVADRLDGPFTLVRGGAPVVDPGRMTLDGTLYVDPARRPWFVYAHEWIQLGDGTVAAMPLTRDLAAAGPPRVLFHGSDAPWGKRPRPGEPAIFVTDGPELFRTRTGRLLMLWSSYDDHGYVQGLARSKSGTLSGPWEQLPPLVRADSGHGMVFRRFDGTLTMVLHRPFRNARGKLYRMRDTGDAIAVVCELTALDGETRPTHAACDDDTPSTTGKTSAR